MAQPRQQSYPHMRNGYVRTARFTVSGAYAALRAQGVGAFPKHLQNEELLAWAFDKARAVDRGYEAEYPEGNDFLLGDVLNDLIYENVRMWAEAGLRQPELMTA